MKASTAEDQEVKQWYRDIDNDTRRSAHPDHILVT
jgi:hypothetical protein